MAMNEKDDDLAKVLAATPWSAILIPLALAVLTVIGVVLVVVYGN